ncbi:DNA polymerase III subunit delta [uncultured Gemmiger sp.]|uniref:DNA polymerase III subunit delta n=1 Tax=uncultured Gemmiger sp. TaxID=1623490 RepID=UPI0025CB865F|nr:DNA polymerase III subunit delta [uncultured Gemmiger sp.]
MLYSENELKKRLKTGCGIFYFYSSEEALVRDAANKVEHALRADDPETTVLPGPAPSVEEIVLAAGTISFFGGRRLVELPLIRPSAYSDKDLQDICDTFSDTENAVFLLTSVFEERYGKIKPGKREQKLISACEKLGYCAQVAKPGRAMLQKLLRMWAEEMGTNFAPGADSRLLDRCGEDQFLLHNEVDKLAALSDYSTVTVDMVQTLGTVTLDADTFDMVKLVAAGQTGKALQKLKALLELQNDPVLIAGALVGNYLDIYRVFLAKRSRRPLSDAAKDFGYTGKWQYRLSNAEKAAGRFNRGQLEESLSILQQLDLDLKSSKLDSDLLLQKALCQLAQVRESR